MGAFSSHSDDLTLKNCLFGTATFIENADIDKYGYSGDGTGFDRKSIISFPGGGFGQNLIIFGVDMSSCVHVDNRKKDILILRRGETKGQTLAAEKTHSINFTLTKKNFCLSLHYIGSNSYLFVNDKEILKFKAKDLEIVAAPLCLGNISKDWSEHKMKN